jgi:hypothetical protein
MPTTLRITNTASDYTPSNYRGAWDDTGGFTTVSFASTPSGTAANHARAETNASTTWDVGLVRAVASDADVIQSAGNLAGTVEWVFYALESSSLANFVTHVHIYVTAGDSDTVRGTVLSNFIGSSEWPDAGVGLTDGSQAISSVAVQVGDRVVVEYGYQAQNSSTTSRTGTTRVGGSGLDLPVGFTTSTRPGNFTFSDTNGVFAASGTDADATPATGTGQAYNATTTNAPLVNVNATPATGTGTAHDPGVTPAYCGPNYRYFVEVDWNNDGVWTDPYDDVSDRLLERVSVGTEYGRDDARALLPLAAGQMRFELCDPEGIFNDDNSSSPLAGDVVPGRPARLRVEDIDTGVNHILFSGFIDDIRANWNRVYSTTPIIVSDGLAAKLQDTEISTAVYWGIKTGDAVEVLLDAIGWDPAMRRIDQGATTIPWYWEERVSAFVALQRIVASEGPPSLAYIDPADGYFVFEDRHHRLLRERSQISQATFCVNYPGCGSPVAVEPVREFVSGSKVYNAGDFPLVVSTSAAVEVGDELIVIQGDGWGTLAGMPTPTASGVAFTQVTTADSQTNDPHIIVWKGTVTNAGVQAVSVGQSSAGNSDVYLGVYVFDGDTNPVIEDAAGSGSTSTTASHVAPSVDAVGTNDVLLCAWMAGSNTGDSGTYTIPATMTLDAERDLDPFSTMAWAQERLDTSGATGTRTALLDGTSQAHVAVSVVVRAYGPTCPEGSFPYTDPFQFTQTRQNIINHAQFVVEQRQVGDVQVIWETTEPVDLDNDFVILRIDQSSDPFIDAEVDAPYIGAGTLMTSLDRTSGKSVSLTLTGVGQVHVQSVTVRGRLLTAVNTQVIETEDAASIAEFSRSTYAPDAPWISPNDAVNVSDEIVQRWKRRTPIIRLRVANCSDEQLAMMMDLVIGDRVTIINQLVNLSEDFIIERIEREITGRGKLHAVTFACESAAFSAEAADTVFRFDTTGQGFDDGLLAN